MGINCASSGRRRRRHELRASRSKRNSQSTTRSFIFSSSPSILHACRQPSLTSTFPVPPPKTFSTPETHFGISAFTRTNTAFMAAENGEKTANGAVCVIESSLIQKFGPICDSRNLSLNAQGGKSIANISAKKSLVTIEFEY